MYEPAGARQQMYDDEQGVVGVQGVSAGVSGISGT
jgi:hypothetical protein